MHETALLDLGYIEVAEFDDAVVGNEEVGALGGCERRGLTLMSRWQIFWSWRALRPRRDWIM